MIYNNTSWRPDFYLLGKTYPGRRDLKCLEENTEMGIPCFVNENNRNKIRNLENTYFFDKDNTLLDREFSRGKEGISHCEIESKNIEQLYKYWSDDISDIIYGFHSSYMMLQIIFYMGFDKIYLLGHDLGLGYHDPHMTFEDGLDPFKFEEGTFLYLTNSYKKNKLFKSVINAVVYKCLVSDIFHLLGQKLNILSKHVGTGQMHFSSDYLTKPKDYTDHNDQHIRAHKIVHRIAVEKDINVYNATFGGELEVYERVELPKVI